MKATLLHNSEIDKPQWDKLVSGSPQGSVFTGSRYLDTILPGAWSGIVVFEDNEPVALMPVFVKQKWGLKYALQPILAKYWGILFRQSDFSGAYKEYSFKKKAVKAIIECIPGNLISFGYNFHPAFDYALPFTWESYSLSPRYTFLLDARGKPENALLAEYSKDLKKNIRSATDQGITIIQDNSASRLIKVLEQNRIGGKTIYDPEYYQVLEKIADIGLTTNTCFCLTALNAENETVASSIYLKDNKSVYTLFSIMDKRFSKTDASSLLAHRAIVESATLQLKFDFLGSMMEPVESYNRRFGAIPVPYLHISKKSRFLHAFGK